LTKYCPNCGTPNDDNARFCVKCGYNFEQQAGPSAQYKTQQPAYQQGPQAQPQPSQVPPPSQGYTPTPYQQMPQTPSQPSGYPPPGPQIYYQQPYPGTTQYNQGFQSASTMSLLAFIFSLIILIIYVIGLISDAGDIATINSYVASGGIPSVYASTVLGELYAYIIVYLILLVFDIILFLRIYRIYSYIKTYRFQEAHQLDSIMWIILGFIFGGIITGVFMLLTKSNLEKGLGYPSTI